MKLKSNERIVKYHDRTFILTVCGDGILGMANVHIDEYLPNAKIFKRRYKDSKCFWVEDYETIEAGAQKMLASYLHTEAEILSIRRKWEDFTNEK